jgi:hypothetical protein
MGLLSLWHGMAHPQDVDGDGLQLSRVAGNTLNKQPQTDDKRWSSGLGVERWANNTSP